MMPDPASELATDRLTLEPLRHDHADEMVSVLDDLSLYEFTGGEPPTSDQLVERYRHQVEGSGRADERWLNWIVRRKDTAEAAGYVQATVTGDCAELAWLIGVSHQRLGFAREASKAMLACLGANGVSHFLAHIAVGHTGSERVAEWLGLERSGSFDDDGEQLWLLSRPTVA
ncbi:MAG: GNAT family N-acetyltransferase [Actinomycetota bacterium]